MKVSVSKVSPHPLNETIYKLSNIDDLVVSIDEVGLLQPLVVNQQYQVISGHRRLEAVRKLGWSEVDVEVIETSTEDETKSLLVHYNKQRVKTCREVLNETQVLRPLYRVGQGKRTDLTTSVRTNRSTGRDILAESVGIPSSRLAKLEFVEKENPDYIDAIDEGKLTLNQSYLILSRQKNEREGREPKPSHAVTSSTDEFIFHNKSSDSMVEVVDESVDLIFTSPPYYNKRDYDKVTLGSEKSPDDYVVALVNHLRDCSRVIKDTGSFFLNIGDTYDDGNLLNIPHRVCIQLQREGWILRNTIIWNKTNPKPQSTRSHKSLNPTYEFIFHLVRGSNYKYKQTLVPTKSNSNFTFPRHRNRDTPATETVTPIPPSDGKIMGDFWDETIIRSAVARNVPVNGGVEHPAPFPEDIVTLPILQSTDEGDLVLDPFMGTGTTGRVANRLNRLFVGYDVTDYR